MFKKVGLSPSSFAAQSITTASNSVHAGLLDHWKSHQPTWKIQNKKLLFTLNPGLQVLLEYKSPSIPSKVHAAG